MSAPSISRLHLRRSDADLSVSPQRILEAGDRIGVLAPRASFPALRALFGGSEPTPLMRVGVNTGAVLLSASGAGDEESSFVACSFWMVSALQLCGRGEEARALMDALVDGEDSALNDVGVLAEMVDPATGHWLGNLPQALSHLALVNAAITVHEHSRGG